MQTSNENFFTTAKNKKSDSLANEGISNFRDCFNLEFYIKIIYITLN